MDSLSSLPFSIFRRWIRQFDSSKAAGTHSRLAVSLSIRNDVRIVSKRSSNSPAILGQVFLGLSSVYRSCIRHFDSDSTFSCASRLAVSLSIKNDVRIVSKRSSNSPARLGLTLLAPIFDISSMDPSIRLKQGSGHSQSTRRVIIYQE